MIDLFAGGRDLEGRLTILHAPLQGAAGYMSSIDRYPASVHPISNQRDMLYIDSRADFGAPSHLVMLTHELQHVAHGWADPDEETWINEGLSELAAWLGGFPAFLTGAFLSRPDTSLVRWPDTPLSALPNYAGASLFMRYLLEQTGEDQLDQLVAEPSDGIAGMEAYLNTVASSLSFDDLYPGWAVDNYASQEFIQPSAELTGPGSITGLVPQFGTQYIALEPSSPLKLSFFGDTQTSLLPVAVQRLCPPKWSGKISI